MARPKNLQQSLPLLGRFYRHFWPKLRKQRRLMGTSFAVLLAEVLLRLLEPWPLSLVVDWVIAPPSSPGQGPTLNIDAFSPTTLITLAAFAVVVTTGLRALARYLSAVGFALIGNRLLTEVRGELYRHLQRLSLSYHDKARGGDLTLRVIGDVGMVREVVVTAMLPLLGNLLILVGMLTMMAFMHWQLALVALTTVPMFWLSTTRLSRRISDVAKKQRRTEGQMASTAAESLAAIETVQALALDDAFSESFEGESQRSLKEGVKGKRLSAQLERTTDVLNAVAQALVLWFGAHLVLKAELSAGELLVFLSYLRAAFRPVRNFAKYTARIAKASAAGERVLQVLEESPEVADREDAVEAPDFETSLSFKSVGFEYEAGHPALRDVSFELRRGQRVAVVGPSGSGKSTLVSLCLRLHDPGSGSILLDGTDLRELTLASVRSQMSVVLQDTLLFAGNVRDNIAYGSPDSGPAEVEAAARAVGADDFIRTLPDGYDTIVGEKGVTLSRGQRQRISFARAAIRPAPILILDEVTTGLDEENKRVLLDALDRVASGRTVLTITHELALAVDCDTILFLEAGRIVEHGTHSALMEQRGRYASLYRMQESEVSANHDAVSG